MPDNVADFAVERGLGTLERRVRLGGRLTASSAREQPVELCLTRSGVWLVAASGRFSGILVDLCQTQTTRYEIGRLRDRILIGDPTSGPHVPSHVLYVPPGRAAETRRCIALGRIRQAGPDPRASRAPAVSDRYLARVDETVTELVQRELKGEDVLVAIAPLGLEVEVISAFGATVKQSTHLVLTAERVFRVRLSELGDANVEELAGRQDLHVHSKGDALLLSDGQTEFSISGKSQSLYAELAELAQLVPAERLYEAGRRLWLAARDAARPLELARAASARQSTLAPLAELGLRLQNGEQEAEVRAEWVVATLERENVGGELLAEVWSRWEFSDSSGRDLVNSLGRLGGQAEPWALELHRKVTEARGPAAGRPALLDLELAEHELLAGDPARARTLAEARLQALGPDEDSVAGPERASLSHLERVRLYEVLVTEAERRGASSVRALSALSRLEPTSEPRLRLLARAASADAAEARIALRAGEVLECVAPGGLRADLDAASEEVRALDSQTLDERVRHPLGLGSGRLAARLSELIASVPEPDLGFLRDFCEELTQARHPDAVRALARATRLLGLPEVRAYVSHGARSVGLRAFGSRDPFVLVGASHLAADSSQSLCGRELDFALGAELAHLAFGHQRVTVSEVWAGAAGKTRDVLLALGVMLPVVREIGGARAQRILGRLTNQAIDRAMNGAMRLPELFGRSASEPPSVRALGQHNEELIMAHRLVQLSADRAGLLAAEKLAPSLRGVLLTRSEYHPLLALACERGLFSALAERQGDGPAFVDLSVRIRSLIAFYLAPDFDAILERTR